MTVQDLADTKRSAGRPRCVQTHGEILEAAADLLEREQYRNITVDRIAAEAKVGKQTIYRWWETKADLVLEAYLARILTSRPNASATGDAIEDIRADLRRMIDSMNNKACSTAIRGLVAEAQFDDAFRARFADVFVAAIYAAARPLLSQGVASGQLRADLDVDLALHVLYGTIAMRFLSDTRRLDLQTADDLVDFLLPSLVPGAPVVAPPVEARASVETPAWVF